MKHTTLLLALLCFALSSAPSVSFGAPTPATDSATSISHFSKQLTVAAKKKDKKDSKKKKGAKGDGGAQPEGAKGTSYNTGREAGLSTGGRLRIIVGIGSYASACLIEADSGKILLQEHATERTYVGDSTRLMLLLLATEQLERQIVNRNTPITFSEKACITTGINSQKFSPGDTITLEQALYILGTQRATSTQVAVAETLFRSTENALQAMNAKARMMGMTKTQYYDFTGLDGVAGPMETERQLSLTSARDFTLLGRELLRRPICAAILGTKEYLFTETAGAKPQKLKNTTRLLVDPKLGHKECVGLWQQPMSNHGGASALYAFNRNNRKYILAIMNGYSTVRIEEWAAFLLDKCVPPKDGSTPKAQPEFYVKQKKH